MTTSPSGNGGENRDDETGGAGPEGTIPDSSDGIGATTLDEPSNFEPEEDDAEADPEGKNAGGGA